MNLFGGFGFGQGNGGSGSNCICQIIWLLFLLQIFGCDTNFMNGNNCMDLILLLLLLSSCGCNGGYNTPCGNN